MAKKKDESFEHLLKSEWEAISYVFLGIGLVLFLMNISAMLGLSLTWGKINYSYFGFDASVFSSMVLIVYIVYTLNERR